jgi:hypothetical protein
MVRAHASGTRSIRFAANVALLSASALLSPSALTAQIPAESEVRQLVTFRFQPGMSGEGIDLFRERAVPLYERNEAMLSFRAFREVESPVPLDLILVSSFRGMAGMDASNDALGTLAERAGSSLGEIYRGIAAISESHDDQFVEMLAPLGVGDASSRPLLAMVWYQILPGESDAFERSVKDRMVRWEQDHEVPSATGRFLVADGWHYLRFLGFDSLGAYQNYWTGLRDLDAHETILRITVRRREVILAPVRELWVR